MRRDVLTLVLALSLVLPGLALADGTETHEAKQQSLELERISIEKAARDYVDGWYEGDAERMQRALHPDLAKRRVEVLSNDRAVLSTISADAMVEYTRMGVGKKSYREGQVNEVTILDVSSTSASVKTVSHQFIDYLHLARLNGEWRIVNVLWVPIKSESD